MKTRLAALLLCFLLLISAGCISLGQQTTDLMMGEEKVGTITLSPNADGTVNAEITAFGMTFTKENLTLAEAETLVESAASGDALPPAAVPSVPENAGEPDEVAAFVESIFNMPLTNSGDTDLSSGLNFSLAAENLAASAESMEALIGGIFGI